MKKRMKLMSCILSVLMLMLAVAGCGGNSGTAQQTLSVYNWGDYIDPEVLEMFEEEYPDIKVTYDMFDSNEAMLAKLEGGAEYDICFPSDYAIEKMIAKDMLQEIDHSKLTNLGNIDEKFMDLDFDPDNKYSIPYFWGTVGILYNTDKVTTPIDSWNALWDETYKGEIIMYDSVRDSMVPALSRLGYDINTRNISELEEAGQSLIDQKKAGLVKAYMMDNVKGEMINGSSAMAVVYSGDAIYCMQESEEDNLAYVVPKEGSNIWFDNVVITKSCENTDAAHKFIDFLLRPEIAKMNSEYVGYSTPNKAALEIIDESYTSLEAYNPPDDVVERCKVFRDLGDFEQEYSKIWERVKMSN